MNDIQLPDLTAANAASSVGISDYSQYGWYSIGSRYVNGAHVIFRGSLDGQNHVIKNFTSSLQTRRNPPPTGIRSGTLWKRNRWCIRLCHQRYFSKTSGSNWLLLVKRLCCSREAYDFVGSLVV
jgi:hypothetical protein